METNETYFVKMSGKVNIPDELIDGHSYVMKGEFGIEGTLRTPNHDGTFNTNYLAKPLTLEIELDNGEKVKGKDPSSNSQKIRMRLFGCYMREGYVDDFNKVYDEFTNMVMGMTPALLDQVIKKLND